MQDATGIVTPSAHLEDHDTLFLVSSRCTVNHKAVGYQICKCSEPPNTITTDTHLTDFRVSTPEVKIHQTNQSFNTNIHHASTY